MQKQTKPKSKMIRVMIFNFEYYFDLYAKKWCRSRKESIKKHKITETFSKRSDQTFRCNIALKLYKEQGISISTQN